jgi:EAL domain-containing protein (putative c-di-GMP-specific phosphodiesterase class I)
MAHGLLLTVVGEGVETLEQAQSLRELGCEELQGYLFSAAIPAGEFDRFLEREKSD